MVLVFGDGEADSYRIDHTSRSFDTREGLFNVLTMRLFDHLFIGFRFNSHVNGSPGH